MRNQFDTLVKALQRETTELKTIKRLSTKTLKTKTTSIATWGTVRKANQQIFPGYAAYIQIDADQPAPFMVTLSNEEHRNYRIFAYDQGVIVAPDYTRDLDLAMGDGDKTVNFTVNITTTDEVTLTATQMDFQGA